MAELTQREEECLFYIANGLRNREIASLMNVTGKTARQHTAACLDKWKVSTRTELAVLAIARGYVDASEAAKTIEAREVIR